MTIWTPGEDERDYFNAFVMTYGTEVPKPEKSPWIPPGGLVKDGFCWSGAWEAARRSNGRYVEGMCILTQDDGSTALVRAHAWAETLATGRIIEATAGYENTTRYMGYAMSPRVGGPADMHSRIFDLTQMGRCSVIEWLITQGWEFEDIHDLLKEE